MVKSVCKLKVHNKLVFGNMATILKTSDDTDGNLSIIEIELAANGRKTKHYHVSYHETLTVQEGELIVNVNGRNILLKNGESCRVYKGVIHYFRNKSSNVVRFSIEFRPGQPIQKGELKSS